MGIVRLNESDMLRMINEAVNVILSYRRIVENFDQSSGKATLYHGSPYKFDKFSISKINTGQHSQDFGRGLYFTSDKETAKFYADELSNTMTLKDKFDMTVHSFTDTEGTFTNYLQNNYSLLVKTYVKRYMENGIGDPAEWEKFLDLMGKTIRYAYLYTVEVSNPKFMDRSEYVSIQKSRSLTDSEMNELLLSNGYNGIIYDMNTRKLSPRDFTGEKNVVIIDDSIINIVDREMVTFDYVLKLKI